MDVTCRSTGKTVFEAHIPRICQLEYTNDSRMKLSLLADVLLVRDGSVGTTLGSSQRTSSLPREIWFVEVVVLIVFLILQGQLEHERFKVEHRILRIGLSFETLQQHSSFRPTSAQLGKSLSGPGDTLHQLT